MKVLYSGGPGDLVGTFRFWQKGEDDPSQIAVTYSRQFYDYCQERGCHAVAISSFAVNDQEQTEQFVVLNRPRSAFFSKGVLYHMGQLVASAKLVLAALKYKPDVVVIADFDDWYCLALLCLFRFKIVPSLHCTFWSIGSRPRSLKAKVQQKLNSWFWRHCVAATICISPECERQLKTLVPQLRSPVLQARPTYRRSFFELIKEPVYSRQRFSVLFAGRIEENKGVLELFEAAQILEHKFPGIFKWSICGTGGFLERLREQVLQAGASGHFQINGHLERHRMLEEISRCDAFIVPTRPEFSEGLNKVAVEGVLAGRPVVASRYVPANEVLHGAVTQLDEVDPKMFADAIASLYLDADFYQSRRACARRVTEQFYTDDTGWKAALGRALDYC